MLLPNNKAGEAPDWEERLDNVSDWLISNKADGGRVEIYGSGDLTGRSLKNLPSMHMNRMAEDLALLLQFDGVIEAEFYSPNMNFSEIMHFFKTEDVTSDHTVSKYEKLWAKSEGVEEKGWPYPGRDVKWATTWHPCLRFYVFDHLTHSKDSRTKNERYENLVNIFTELSYIDKLACIIPQYSVRDIDAVYQAFDQAIIDGYEGIVLMYRYSRYKMGRHTLKSKQAFKIKDDIAPFDGIILSVEEATEAREGSERTVNELGRSVTSKLKEDRIPSGMAKGFKVSMDDGNELTVSLNDFNHAERRELLKNENYWIGQTIRFTGAPPVKAGGCPRHSHYSRGNVRDSK